MDHTKINATWDPAVIVLSFVVACLGAYPAVILMSSIKQYSKIARPVTIIALSSMSLAGVGIWSMHFVGMRALSLGHPVFFRYGWTVASFIFGFVGCFIGFYLLQARMIHSSKLMENCWTIPWSWWNSLFEPPPFLDIAFSALFLALGVCAMHFVGVFSMAFQGYITWNVSVIAGSCLLAWGVACAGLLLCTSFKHSAEYPLPVSAVIAAAVCGMHYTGMVAAHFHYINSSTIPTYEEGIPNDRVELIVAIIALTSSSIFAAVLRNLMIQSERAAAERIKFEHEQYYTMISEYIPISILQRIVTGEMNIVERSEQVSVMFCDIAGFTAMCMNDELTMVKTLVLFFGAMDTRLALYGIQKIKTVGDCYMCACGCPVKYKDQMTRILKYSVDAIGLASRLSREVEEDLNVRIGINTGDVTSGVVGYNKATYDIWGSAVNLASRMESSGSVGGIQISEFSMGQLATENFNDSLYPLQWTKRTVNAKGIGSVTAYVWVPDVAYIQHIGEEIDINVSLDWVNKLTRIAPQQSRRLAPQTSGALGERNSERLSERKSKRSSVHSSQSEGSRTNVCVYNDGNDV